MSENKNLKLRFKLKELEFEIEGNEKTVKEEFENFKRFVTNDILPQINNVPNPAPTKNLSSEEKPLSLHQTTDVDLIDITDFPVMKEIVLRDLPKGEQEWVLIYAFYASNYGTETFTRVDITELYGSSNRKTKKNMSTLSVQLQRVLKKRYIKFANDTEYILKSEGITQAKLILAGKSTTKVTLMKSTKKSTSGKSENSSKKSQSSSKKQGFKLDRSLNLRPEGKLSLIDFVKNYKMDTTPQKILLIVYYLREILKIEYVNANHIYTGFEKLKIRVPKSLYQLISDSKNKMGWLEFESMDNINLSIQGRNSIKYDLIKK